MPLPRLRLSSPPAPGALVRSFDGAGPVLWLAGASPPPEPAMGSLHDALGARRYAPSLRCVPVVGPRPGRNPWAVRQDRQAPLRWGPGDGLAGRQQLADQLLDDGVAELAGLVLWGLCAELADQPLRALLRQIAPHLAPDAPWLACEPNGRQLSRVVRSLGRPVDDRGEGRGTVRAVEELRRLFETGGLGITQAWAGSSLGRRDRLARRLVGQDAASDWLLVAGRAIRGGEALR